MFDQEFVNQFAELFKVLNSFSGIHHNKSAVSQTSREGQLVANANRFHARYLPRALEGDRLSHPQVSESSARPGEPGVKQT